MIKSPKTILRFLKDKKVIVCALPKEKDGRQLMGCTDYRTNVIKIHNGQTIELRVSSLIHECLHRLNTHYKKEEHEPMFEATEKEVFAKLTKKEYNNLKKYIS